jgi:hypothetical protein
MGPKNCKQSLIMKVTSLKIFVKLCPHSTRLCFEQIMQESDRFQPTMCLANIYFKICSWTTSFIDFILIIHQSRFFGPED